MTRHSATRSLFDLLPCPWCGGPADIEEIGGKDGAAASFSVGCHDGDGSIVCFGYQSLTSFARKSDATTAWNRRAINADLLEALEGVVRVADRKTIEFDAARAAIAKHREREATPNSPAQEPKEEAMKASGQKGPP